MRDCRVYQRLEVFFALNLIIKDVLGNVDDLEDFFGSEGPIKLLPPNLVVFLHKNRAHLTQLDVLIFWLIQITQRRCLRIIRRDDELEPHVLK